MIIPIEKSERVYKYAITGWIVDAAGTRACYEFGSKINEEARITCFVYVRFKYGILKRLFQRGQMEKSRFIARFEIDESEFLYHFNTVRGTLWRLYEHQIPFRFLGTEELTTIQFSRGFLGRVGFCLIKAWRAVVDLFKVCIVTTMVPVSKRSHQEGKTKDEIQNFSCRGNSWKLRWVLSEDF